MSPVFSSFTKSLFHFDQWWVNLCKEFYLVCHDNDRKSKDPHYNILETIWCHHHQQVVHPTRLQQYVEYNCLERTILPFVERTVICYSCWSSNSCGKYTDGPCRQKSRT